MERCRPIDIELEGREGCVVVQDPEDECCHTVQCLDEFNEVVVEEVANRGRSQDSDEFVPIEGRDQQQHRRDAKSPTQRKQIAQPKELITEITHKIFNYLCAQTSQLLVLN